MRQPIFLLCLLLLIQCIAPSPPSETSTSRLPPAPTDPYFGITATETPQLLLPDFISTRFGEYNGTFNADGSEFLYTISIPQFDVLMSTRLQADNTWSPPEMLPFSGQTAEFDPLFHPDGKGVYYCSRPPYQKGQKRPGSKVWYTQREGDGWATPVAIPIKGPHEEHYFCSATQDGTLYFNSAPTGDLFKATQQDSGYVMEPLGAPIESPRHDADPFIAPDESYLIFRSYRQGGFGSGDFYISFKLNGQWTSPENLGRPINTKYNEMCPYVTTDGRFFIFASNRLQETYYAKPPSDVQAIRKKYDSYDNGQQNIYYMKADFIKEMKKKYQ
ncbi:MAG: hypothetical protein AAGG75_13720 [Bacteroidota bacterium]